MRWLRRCGSRAKIVAERQHKPVIPASAPVVKTLYASLRDCLKDEMVAGRHNPGERKSCSGGN